MNINTSRYEEIFESFKQYYPDWEDRVESYSPKNEYAIRVTMRDGSRVDYNIRTNCLRWLRGPVVTTPSDVTDDDCRRIFAGNLNEFMRIKGFNQITLSERTGLSTAVISKYMRGKTTPTITALRKIAYAMNCAPEELLD